MATVLERPLEETNPLSAEVLKCPHAYNARLRREAPVYRCPATGIFFVSEYDAIKAVVKDHDTFSNRFAQAMRRPATDERVAEVQRAGYPPVDTMLTQDPPAQRRFRSLVNQAFTPKRVNALEGDMTALALDLIDRFAARGRCELVSEFCVPLPLTVIADQLGVPRSDLELFKKWSDGFVTQLSRLATPDEELEAAKLILEFQRYFARKLEERRLDARDDIISDIVHAKVEGERPLDTAESLSILQQLLVAGNETTTSAIAEGMLLLIRNPEQMRLVEADRSLVPNLVEEVLRLSTPTANMWRVAARDTELAGVKIPAGAMIQVRYSSANRDAAQFPDPDTFDVRRANAKTNLAFGQGIHMCVGAGLARKEMQVAFSVLLDRLCDFSLDVSEGELHWPPNVLLRGLDRLPIRFAVRQ